MSNESERRAPGATRFPFEGLVEIGTSLGPAFEAQAVDVSGDGMHLRTAYLPELGQPVTCRFDAGATGTVLAAGEVVWREEAGKGGECGIRFTDLDAESEEALKGMLEPAQGPSRVRLHIEGLGMAMKAKVRDSSRTKVTVGNDLSFLQVGKHLELEDAETGEKRPAHIARVELEVDPETQIPRLVVGLRYEDEEASEPQVADAAVALHAKDVTPEPSVLDADDADVAMDAAVDEESAKMKSNFARNAAKVTPAILALAKRAKITAAMLWAKRSTKAAPSEDNAPRRTTAPPPGGALHAAGRKVVRSEADVPIAGLSRFAMKLDTKRKVAIGAAAGLTVAILFAALRHKPATPPQVAEVAAADTNVATGALPPALTVDPMLAQVPPPPPPTVVMPTDVVNADPKKPLHVAPFSNGNVTHGTVLHLKMDGMIAKINGASQPTGFTVSIPGRKSIEPAGPLAARDSRIGSIKVSNDAAGAELDVNFKDGVPSYIVRAKGDVLEVVLAPQGIVGAATQAKATLPKPAAGAVAPAAPKKKPATPHKK